tara:strand:- start:820 stop:1407 length:588 start_codon:yes stop_codon:yes gene_type:complete
VTTEPLNPSVANDYSKRYAENTSGIIAAIVSCIVAQGGSVASYPANTGGVIKALLDLKTAISSGGGGGGGGGGSADTVELSITAGESVALDDVVYLHTDGKVYKAINNDTRAKATVVGVVKTAANANANATIVLRGKVTSTGAFGAAGNVFWLSNSTGQLSGTPAAATGDFVTKVGTALDANNLVVMIEPPVELA